VSGFCIGALGGSLAGNMFTTKAVVEMFECVTVGAENAEGCATNPFFTPWPYLFITISLTLACVSLYMLAVGLRTFEALYMITVFEGFMIISGAISGNVVMDEMDGQPTYKLVLYALSISIILTGLWILLRGEQTTGDGVRMLSRTRISGDAEMAGTTREMEEAPHDDPMEAGPKAEQ